MVRMNVDEVAFDRLERDTNGNVTAVSRRSNRSGEMANNHLLNAALMQLCSTLFGNSELSLRLPNVRAHAVYLVCSVA